MLIQNLNDGFMMKCIINEEFIDASVPGLDKKVKSDEFRGK